MCLGLAEGLRREGRGRHGLRLGGKWGATFCRDMAIPHFEIRDGALLDLECESCSALVG
jgi:hypothetical protein